MSKLLGRRLFAIAAATLCIGGAKPMGGQHGIEFAIDSPWRLEPHRGNVYGSIPIAISFHDLNFHGRAEYFHRIEVVERLAQGDSASNFRTEFAFSDLAFVDRKLEMSTRSNAPKYEKCKPNRGESCEELRHISKLVGPSIDPTLKVKGHEWHALLWYPIRGPKTPGRDVHIEVSVLTSITSSMGQTGVANREWRNYSKVHLAKSPLPRFPGQWLYGDLHYHSQMTDNEGESATSYRNVIAAMGAMGLDFVFATDHASDSDQFSIPILQTTGEARDLNPKRFVQAKDLLYSANGVNVDVKHDAENGNVPRWSSSKVLPQIYMGEEVDSQAEISAHEQAAGYVLYGDQRAYRWSAAGDCDKDLEYCKAKYSAPAEKIAYEKFVRCVKLILPALNPSPIQVQAARRTCIDKYKAGTAAADQRFVVLDEQGGVPPYRQSYPARQHSIYFPFDSTVTPVGFVSSATGKFGGATKRLETIISEMQGVAFAAHPTDGHVPDSNFGPDVVPLSRVQLETIWASPKYLGLQFWNENEKFKRGQFESNTKYPGEYPFMEVVEREGWTRHIYHMPWVGGTSRNSFPWTWGEPGISDQSLETNTRTFDGMITWDHYLRRGLDPSHTAKLSWLGPQKVRKFFAAAGSDGHGDLNYRRAGRPSDDPPSFPTWTDFPATDVAIGNPRNLVSMDATGTTAVPVNGRYSNIQVIDAIKSGSFSITDGPALRIAVDLDNDQQISPKEPAMGSIIVARKDRLVPIIVEWASTEEFGSIDSIYFFIGNSERTMGSTEGLLQRQNVSNSNIPRLYNSYHEHTELRLGNIAERYPKLAYRGTLTYYLDPGKIVSAAAPNAPVYVRAIATSTNKDSEACIDPQKCVERMAMTNPIWVTWGAGVDVVPSDICSRPLLPVRAVSQPNYVREPVLNALAGKQSCRYLRIPGAELSKDHQE